MTSTGRYALRLLLDTNIVITHEDGEPRVGDASTADASTMVELARTLGFEVAVSHGSKTDFLRCAQPLRRRRHTLLRKYYTVLQPVPENREVRAQFPAELNDNDRSDVEVLSGFASGAATVLVTEDRRMRTRAAAGGLDNVFSVEDAIDRLRALQDPTLVNAVAAQMPAAYQISIDAPIFASFGTTTPTSATGGPTRSSGGVVRSSSWATRASRLASQSSRTSPAPSASESGS